MGRKRSTKDADLSPCEPRRSRRLANRQSSTLCVADTNPLAIEPLKLEIESNIPKSDISNSSIYGSLQKDSKEIRILSLEPGKWDDPISCQLSTISLASLHPPYETLSYVWEAERGYGEVLLDGQSHQVTKNIFLALRRLRIANANRILWVDALYIDQNSNFEKSHQVGLMKEIYKSCEQVYIWLGEYSSGKGSALDTRTISEARAPCTDEEALVDEETNCDPAHKAFQIVHRLAKDGAHLKDVSEDLSPEIVHALDLTASSPWWTRLWVVQELVLPPKAIVLYGRFCAR